MSISLCEDCVYYSYDEESDSYYCDEQLDEDEMASFLRGKLTACPFYHPGQSDYYLAGKQGRKGAVLTCKQRLVDYYAKFCFVDEGVTDKSVHGGVVWHQMRITF